MTKPKKYGAIITISILVGIAVGATTLTEKTAQYIDKKIVDCTDREIDKKFGPLLQRIESDVEEIKIALALMNKDNPEYERTIKAIKLSKKRKE